MKNETDTTPPLRNLEEGSNARQKCGCGVDCFKSGAERCPLGVRVLSNPLGVASAKQNGAELPWQVLRGSAQQARIGSGLVSLDCCFNKSRRRGASCEALNKRGLALGLVSLDCCHNKGAERCPLGVRGRSNPLGVASAKQNGAELPWQVLRGSAQ